ncbi:DMT family transporter [Gordonia alkanivorans]|jgi:drug/metabolite transporter (DMT)-like permease|uniref:DMT family transporter n=1 Tax=Gordonia alkanivorans TaxID=84096 RepID=UPI00244CD684|nr:DMT family transporter [Gordonia alkanivorans]MDH3012108.1 DMT family transporter [Gordonia alkanivorans]MDH3021237.1 DMT family transporter [Gordonia alkanivorans]MDH3046462.1 DMT family transporter [Gordonia alkanivorans]MDJ0008668.1 DMT family transporter [Gordonia alkanivorans]MDJ0098686.1 DMT family transporter [Gordonia alkanivorans]
MTSRPSSPAILGVSLPALAALVTVVLWASAFVGIRALGESFSPGAMAFLRLLAAVLPLTVIVLAVRLRRRSVVGDDRPVTTRFPRGRPLMLVIAYGVAWFAGYTILLNWAEQHLDAGTAALLVNLAPILVAVAAGLFFGEGFPRHLVIGMTIAFAGVVLIATGGSATTDAHADWLGVLLGIAAAVLYAAGVLIQKSALRTVDALTATWLGALAGLVATLPFAPTAVSELARADASAIVAVIYLGVGPTAIAFSTWAYALARTDAGAMAATTLVVPAIVIVMSWALLDELPTGVGIVGGVLCIGGVAIARRLFPRTRRGGRVDAARSHPVIDEAPGADLETESRVADRSATST